MSGMDDLKNRKQIKGVNSKAGNVVASILIALFVVGVFSSLSSMVQSIASGSDAENEVVENEDVGPSKEDIGRERLKELKEGKEMHYKGRHFSVEDLEGVINEVVLKYNREDGYVVDFNIDVMHVGERKKAFGPEPKRYNVQYWGNYRLGGTMPDTYGTDGGSVMGGQGMDRFFSLKYGHDALELSELGDSRLPFELHFEEYSSKLLLFYDETISPEVD